MKLKTLLFALPIVLFSCNNQPAPTPESVVDTSSKMEIMVPAQTCYLGTIAKDSVFLKTEKFPNVVTGTLEYKNYEKDSSKGELEGKMSGDTLIAQYRFSSEGTTSISQVVFLIKGDSAYEGFGEMEEKDGVMVFKNLNEIKFDTTLILNQTNCNN